MGEKAADVQETSGEANKSGSIDEAYGETAKAGFDTDMARLNINSFFQDFGDGFVAQPDDVVWNKEEATIDGVTYTVGTALDLSGNPIHVYVSDNKIIVKEDQPLALQTRDLDFEDG